MRKEFKKQIIAQGAEAILIKQNNKLLKKRIKKGYRHEFIDLMLRTSRTKREAKIMEKAGQVIPVPKIIKVDEINKKKLEPEATIEMEFIDGNVLSDALDKLPHNKALSICHKIGQNIAKLHDLGIIHGDLTTSNMILQDEKVYFIDFGLSFHSNRVEDKAVDLYLLKEALEAKHFKNWEEYFKEIIKGYSISNQSNLVLERLKKVESRGRYKGKI